MVLRHVIQLIVLLTVGFTLQACGGSSNSASSTSAGASNGTLSVSLVDAPGDYDHVWITVKDVWFHTDANASTTDSGWFKFPLNAPTIIDLTSLSNGNVSQNLWDGIKLPAGIYQQIRLFLVSTDTANPPAGHSHFNEVSFGGNTFSLRISDPDNGIALIGTFAVISGSTRKLTIDIDAGDDVVDFNGSEYILEPRLSCFDLDHVGAIVGQLSTGATFTKAPHFEIKAETLSADGTYHVVRRATVPDSTGKFILFPVSAATATTTYDILVRGIGYETTIVKGVPVTQGTTPLSNPTSIPTITMTTDTDFASSATITSPTGAWVDFYQTLSGTGTSEVPYEVRFRHFNPLTGAFSGFMLSDGQLQWGLYSSSTVTFTAVDPVEGDGGYQAVAGADESLYSPSALPGSANITDSSPLVAFGTPLTVISPWSGNTITGVISMLSPTAMDGKFNTGVVFAVHRGLIVDAISTMIGDLPVSDVSTGGSYTISNLPGGSTLNPLPSAIYGVEAVLWSTSTATFEKIMIPNYTAIAIPQIADLRTGDGTANLDMLPLFFPLW